MKALFTTVSFYLLIFLILISFSCEKQSIRSHFYGRVTASCDNQTPIANCKITIYREYYQAQTHRAYVGSTVTDNDGYYDLVTDVNQEGKLMGYEYNYIAFKGSGTHDVDNLSFYGLEYSEIEEHDVEVNLNAQNSKAFKFHIKNTIPVNSDDEFNSLMIYKGGGDDPYEIISNFDLKGPNVDTMITKFSYNTSIQYKYSYTKNGILNNIPLDTASNSNCLDTLTIDFFY